MTTLDVPGAAEANRYYYVQNGTIEVTSDRDIYITALSTTGSTCASFPISPSRSAFGYEFYIANYPPVIIYPTEIVITADISAANIVLKKPPGGTNGVSFRELDLQQDGIVFKEISDDEIHISLSPYQSFQLRYTLDFTGLKVTANVPISILSAGECTHVTIHDPSCNHIAAYMPPVDQLGKRFTIAPFAERTSGYIYRVVAVRDNTTLTIDSGSVIHIEHAGYFYERDITNANHVSTVTSDKPVLVAQFSKGYTTDYVSAGPVMMVVPPEEQYVNSISFANFYMDRYYLNRNYLNLITSCDDLDDVLINNLEVSDWIDVLPDADGKMCAARRELNGVNRVNFITHRSSEARFVAFVYGSPSAGHSKKISYGYPLSHGSTQLTCKGLDRFNRTEEVDCDPAGIPGNETESGKYLF